MVIPVTSMDPNDKVGRIGLTNLNYIRGDVPTPYTIYFENVDSATAAAREVFVTDAIDTNRLNIRSVQFTGIGFGDTTLVFDPPIATNTFSQDVDLRPERNTIVRVRGIVNEESGTVSWSFASFDPETMDLTQDVLAGFLPPNVTKPEGEGFVRFTIAPKTDLTTGTGIQNQASIVFDTNEPISTPVFTNTIDKQKPTSSMDPIQGAGNDSTFTIKWRGTDFHSGIAFFNVYISDNGGDFQPWLANTPLTTRQFIGFMGHVYAFYCVATDNAGNVEDKDPIAEVATLTIGTPTPPTSNLLINIIPNPATEKVTIQITAPQSLPNTTIEVFNITGAKVYQTTAQFQAGMNNVQLNLANFEKGLYLVQVRNGDAVLQTKLVKQ